MGLFIHRASTTLLFLFNAISLTVSQPGVTVTVTATASVPKSASSSASVAVASIAGTGSTGSEKSTTSTTSSGTGSGPWCITIDGPSGMTCEANGGGFVGCTIGKQMCTEGGGSGGKIQLIAPGGSVKDVGTQIEPYFPSAGSTATWNIDISYVNGYNYDVSCTGSGINIGSTSGSLWQTSAANNHGCTGGGTAFLSASGVCQNVNGGSLNTPSQAPSFFQSMGSALTGTYLAANQPDPGAFETSNSASITCKARGGYPGTSSAKRDQMVGNPSVEHSTVKRGYGILRHVAKGVSIGASRNHARSLAGFIKDSKV